MGGGGDLTPHYRIVPDQDGGQQGACRGRLIHSGKERVYQPCYRHAEAYAARTSERSSVQMVFVGNRTDSYSAM